MITSTDTKMKIEKINVINAKTKYFECPKRKIFLKLLITYLDQLQIHIDVLAVHPMVI